MCPFCIGAAAWAVAGAVSTAGGLGVLAGVVQRRRAGDAINEAVIPARGGASAGDSKPPSSTCPT